MKKGMILIIIIIIIFYTNSGVVYCNNPDLASLVENGLYSKSDSLFKELLKIDTNNPQISIEYANILFNKSRNSMVNLSMGKLEANEKGFNLIDSTGKEAAKMTEYVTYDTLLSQKAAGILKNAQDKYPYRMDIRFGIAYMYQFLDDFENQFKVISDAITYGKNNPDKLRWKDNTELPEPPVVFLSGTLYDYSVEEYQKETPKGDERYLRLSQLLTDNFPEHPSSFKNIAFYYYNVKNWEKSMLCFEKALSAHPRDKDVLYNLAENYIKLNHIDKGKACLENIIKLDLDKDLTEYAKKRLNDLK